MAGADGYSLKVVINRIQGTKFLSERLMALVQPNISLNITPNLSSTSGHPPALGLQGLQGIELSLSNSNFQMIIYL